MTDVVAGALLLMLASMMGAVAVRGRRGSLPYRSMGILHGTAMESPARWKAAHMAAWPYVLFGAAAFAVAGLASLTLSAPWAGIGAVTLSLIGVSVGLYGSAIGNRAARQHDG